MNPGFRTLRAKEGRFDFTVEDSRITIISPKGEVFNTTKEELGSGISVTAAEIKKYLVDHNIIRDEQ